jgi:hypothetical protein
MEDISWGRKSEGEGEGDGDGDGCNKCGVGRRVAVGSRAAELLQAAAGTDRCLRRCPTTSWLDGGDTWRQGGSVGERSSRSAAACLLDEDGKKAVERAFN